MVSDLSGGLIEPPGPLNDCQELSRFKGRLSKDDIIGGQCARSQTILSQDCSDKPRAHTVLGLGEEALGTDIADVCTSPAVTTAQKSRNPLHKHRGPRRRHTANRFRPSPH